MDDQPTEFINQDIGEHEFAVSTNRLIGKAHRGSNIEQESHDLSTSANG